MNSNSILNCKITQRKVEGSTIYEGTVAMPGATPCKLQKGRGTNATTRYSTKSALVQAARAFASRHNYDDVNISGISSGTSTTGSSSSSGKSRTTRTVAVGGSSY